MTPEPHTARHLLARRIRLLRATHGWSQETLAELSGLHRSYISGIERAQRNISLDNIEKIAHAFEVSLASLLSPVDSTET
jgi:transcriptional regulator with XRE-family HTH domain